MGFPEFARHEPLKNMGSKALGDPGTFGFKNSLISGRSGYLSTNINLSIVNI